MIKGIGVDIIKIDRVKEQDRIARRVLSDEEYSMYQLFTTSNRKAEFLAGRFACKEAYVKALGTGIGKVAFQDITILNDDLGKPYINYPNTHVSIAHEKEYAIAYVVIEG